MLQTMLLPWAQRIFGCVMLAVALTACSGGGGGGASQTVSVQLTGTIRYEDKEYDAYGFTGNTTFKPVRFAVVDLVNDDDSVVATTSTDEYGRYQLSGWAQNPRLRVLAQTNDTIGTTVSIRNYSGTLYAVSQLLDTSTGPVLDLDIEKTSAVAGAFNMMDVFTTAVQFVQQLSNKPMPALNAFWVDKNNKYGTYYCYSNLGTSSCPQGKGIYVLGGTSTGGDSDHYDDDVLYHEFAHYIEGMVGAQDSPGGTHYLTENDQDLRLTWSEGLGGFFPAAIKTWLSKTNPQLLSSAPGIAPTYFIDTYGWYVGIAMDFKNPNSAFCSYHLDCFIYSSNEVAVAKILIELMDRYGMQAVWDIYSNYMASSTPLPATLETFWDGWMAQRAPSSSERNNVSDIFSERQVNYKFDSFESDNDISYSHEMTVCETASCSGETHYIYYDSYNTDKDLTAFYAQKGKSYFVETYDLSNGADTYIRILDRFGNVTYSRSGDIMINDNRPGTVMCGTYDSVCRVHNDGLMLSSELTFTPITSGTYYVEVSSSSSRPKAAGRYGTYSLEISD